VLRAALCAPLLAACTTTPSAPPPPDPLAELAAQARTDAAFADAVAASVPSLAAAAGQVAKARGEHAVALQKEVDRERPLETSAPAPVSSAPAPPADPAGARTSLLEALTAAEQRAAELITTVPRYRAGLLGSVAAGCACLREVIG
jgi:hypothetical protein